MVCAYVHKREKSMCPSFLCPSCTIAPETMGHLLSCSEMGRVQLLTHLAHNLMEWLDSVGMQQDLTYLIGSFVMGWRECSMKDIFLDLPDFDIPFAQSQDTIIWRRFVEGMISIDRGHLVQWVGLREGFLMDLSSWQETLAKKLLEVIHGLWIYQNLTVHNATNGILATRHHDQIMDETAPQCKLGVETLQDED